MTLKREKIAFIAKVIQSMEGLAEDLEFEGFAELAKDVRNSELKLRRYIINNS